MNKWRTRYLLAEIQFDKLWAGIGSSPLTLAIFVAWTLAMVAFGFWAGLKP